jgi:hypothetical protein
MNRGGFFEKSKVSDGSRVSATENRAIKILPRTEDLFFTRLKNPKARFNILFSVTLIWWPQNSTRRKISQTRSDPDFGKIISILHLYLFSRL